LQSAVFGEEKMFSPPLHQLKLDITGPLIDIYILGGEKEK
jgi:hypothetical protein